jgi:hypothetical protein
MIFLVISILLVSAGVFILLFSVFYTGDSANTNIIHDKKNHAPVVTVIDEDDSSVKNIKDVKTVRTLYSDSEEVSELYEKSGADQYNKIAADAVPQNNENNIKSAADLAAGKYNAVLFEDSSRAVDYSTFSMPLDLNTDYSGIKRIGAGEFSFDDSGYSFISEKKLYRFDFHRIREIKTGENYIALMPVSDGSSKLFIFNREYSDIKNAEEKFKQYKKG